MKIKPCTKCHSKESVFYRPYSGERLCSNCFITSIKDKVQNAINVYGMLEHNNRIAIGVSGGKDSLTLLHVLKQIEDETHGSEIIAIFIDEGLEGYRNEAEKIVNQTCQDLKIELIKLSFKKLFNLTIDDFAKKNRKLSICSYCGVLRRRALNEGAKQVNADRLATGHNLDDMAQSALLNLLRGDLSKMQSLFPGGFYKKGFVRRIKPLCEVPEKETTFYSLLQNFEFQSYKCSYAHEAMRNDVRDWILEMEEKRPGTTHTIFQTSLKLIPKKIDKKQNICEKCSEPTSSNLCKVCQMIEDYFKINS
ncbi:TIGR00269 family protein [Candidatus Bathyarchaeota archaeon]|nr:TIGR00269 family protein [Candidatus Bathyarchaeota archaeon]